MLWKKRLSCALLVVANITSAEVLGKDVAVDSGSNYANGDYDSGYYEHGGKIHFKGRIMGVLSQGKQYSISTAPRAAAVVPNKHLISNGFGVEGVTTLFFGNRFAVEFGLGFTMYKISQPGIASISQNYGGGIYKPTGRKQLYAVPVTLTAQYHIAPFGAIRPYVGAGVGGVYMFSKSNALIAKSAVGPVGQVGLDVVMTDDTYVNFDIRQYALSPRVSYKKTTVGTDISPKIRLNPTAISIGMGIKF